MLNPISYLVLNITEINKYYEINEIGLNGSNNKQSVNQSHQ